MPLQKGTIDKKQLKKIKEEIFKNSKPSQKIKIIAVTKNHPYSSILSAYENKIFDIGENKIQELELKIKNKKIPEKIKIHFIGRLQSNKVKKAVKLCDYIQSVNSSRLLKKINKEAKKIDKKQKIYLQINIGKDINKQGFKKDEVFKKIKEFSEYKNIKIKGLMTILPQGLTQKQKRNLYNKTYSIQQKIQKEHFKSCSNLSMGMSGDYVEALKEGATEIRIGTKLYGKRQ